MMQKKIHRFVDQHFFEGGENEQKAPSGIEDGTKDEAEAALNDSPKQNLTKNVSFGDLKEGSLDQDSTKSKGLVIDKNVNVQIQNIDLSNSSKGFYVQK